MEMEVAVEKNKIFGFSPTGSHDVDDMDVFGTGDSIKSTRGGSSVAESALAHKLPPMLKVAIIGESTVGKTAICEAFCKQNFTPASKYSMTCGVQIYGKCITSASLRSYDETEPIREKLGQSPTDRRDKPDEKVNLIILDSAGKDLYRDYLPKYWEKLDSVVLTIDLTSPIALETGVTWMEFVQPSLTSSQFASQAKKNGILIGNKTDLKDQRVITTEAAMTFASDYNLEYFESSVRNNSGLEEPFYFLAQEWFDQGHNNDRETSMFRGQDVDRDREAFRNLRRQ